MEALFERRRLRIDPRKDQRSANLITQGQRQESPLLSYLPHLPHQLRCWHLQ